MNKLILLFARYREATNRDCCRAPQACQWLLPFRRGLFIAVAMLISACASTTPGGRTRLVAPEPISALHSSLDLQLGLATRPNVATPCTGIQCMVDKGFEKWVERLGARLAKTAYETHPELKERIPQFNFIVVEKSEGGSSSDASGTIVIYRGSGKASPDEGAVAYLIANEMGHVIAKHHGEKSAATIISSILVQVLLAPANLARGVAFLASSTATAFGKELMVAGKIPAQQKESDAIALELLSKQGWTSSEITDSLRNYSDRLGNDPWSQEVRRTAIRLAASNGNPFRDAVELSAQALNAIGPAS